MANGFLQPVHLGELVTLSNTMNHYWSVNNKRPGAYCTFSKPSLGSVQHEGCNGDHWDRTYGEKAKSVGNPQVRGATNGAAGSNDPCSVIPKALVMRVKPWGFLNSGCSFSRSTNVALPEDDDAGRLLGTDNGLR